MRPVTAPTAHAIPCFSLHATRESIVLRGAHDVKNIFLIIQLTVQPRTLYRAKPRQVGAGRRCVEQSCRRSFLHRCSNLIAEQVTGGSRVSHAQWRGRPNDTVSGGRPHPNENASVFEGRESDSLYMEALRSMDDLNKEHSDDIRSNGAVIVGRTRVFPFTMK